MRPQPQPGQGPSQQPRRQRRVHSQHAIMARMVMNPDPAAQVCGMLAPGYCTGKPYGVRCRLASGSGTWFWLKRLWT